MIEQVQIFFRTLLIGILVLGGGTQFAATAQTHEIAMTTAKKVGDKIKLYIYAKDYVSIDGATGSFVNGREVEYTLTKQVVTIKGQTIVLHCKQNQLTNIDVSKSTTLTRLECYENQLAELDVSKNAALTELHCYNNRLTSLDVSRNTALKELYCYNNRLTSLDLSKNAALIKISCDQNQIAKLDISKNMALIWLNCSFNQLTSLDISNNISLKRLFCSSNQLKTLDVSKNTALIFLSCSANQLTTLDISKSIALENLYCNFNRLASLDVSKSTTLIELNCHTNQIKGEAMTALVKSLPACDRGEFCVIDTKNPKEQNICTKEQVAIAKGKGWRAMDLNGSWLDRKEYAGSEEAAQESVITMTTTKKIGEKIKLWIEADGDVDIEGVTGSHAGGGWVYYNLTSQVVAIKGKITQLGCSSNQLTSLDVSKNPALTLLGCSSNQLTSLDVSKNAALTVLDCLRNQLTSLDVSKNTALTKLNCASNQLTKLDVSLNTALKELNCYSNRLTTLDVSENKALTWIDYSNNQLTVLDVSKNIDLGTLVCCSNPLEQLDVSQNTALKELFCSNTQLTELNVSKNAALIRLWCYSNQIKDEAMTSLVGSLPRVGQMAEIIIIDTKNPEEGNACTKSQVAIAKTKGWLVYDYNGSWSNRKEYAGSDDNSVGSIDSSSVQIYPNPARDFVQIKDSKASVIVRLYSLDGCVVLTGLTDADGAARLDVSKLPGSIYLLSIGSSYSQRISIRR